MKIIFVADYKQAHPRGFSLCDGFLSLGHNCKYITFKDDADFISSEKKLHSFRKFAYIKRSKIDKFQNIIPSRLFKILWPLLSISLIELCKVPGILKALNKHNLDDADLIIISYSPLSLVIASILSKKARQVKKLVDWRDPYLNNHNIPNNKLRTMIRGFIMRFIDNRVDYHITVSEGFNKRLIDTCKKPIHVIPNGSNNRNALLEEHKKALLEDKKNIKINYFGSIYMHRQPIDDFLLQLERYMLKNDKFVEVNLYGTNKKVIKKLLKDIELSRVSVNTLPRLSYEEFLGKINEGDVNLVIGWNKRIDDHFKGSGVLPTKFWECLGLNVPLLVYSQNTFDEIRSVASEKYSLPIVHDYESLVTFFDSISKKVWSIDTSEFTFQTRAKQILEYINDKENI